MTGQAFHPDLRAARFLPRGVVGPRRLRLIRALTGLADRGVPPGVVQVPVTPEVRVDVYGRTVSAAEDAAVQGRRPALLWIHGGGMVIGHARMDSRFCARAARELGAVVASVDYRLAPEHPYPTPLEDCYTALTWLAAQPDVDPDRIAIGGASAGGGLAAGLALLARDRADVRLAFQLLVYPMIDDRTTVRTGVDERRLRMWNPASNHFGWRSYLGPRLTPGQPDGVPHPAAPARAEDLTGLPPTWIGVGTNDLFHDEDVAYAERLRQAGVPCDLHIVPGAYHGFDSVESRTAVVRDFTRRQIAALSQAIT
ncbi:alpha/beta hydrolase [Actinocorallia populi]|uniref:alpha/beta hydrolase n=1 Tax=Actinocorallia populi TaxID=2079200 RepID=UPI000D0868D8|nr:alpha/beta hydrolase [Actinocorallia populi]